MRRALVVFLLFLAVDARLSSVSVASTIAPRNVPIFANLPAVPRAAQLVGLTSDNCSKDSDCQHNAPCKGGLCDCNAGSSGDYCETLNNEGNMETLGIDRGQPCGDNYHCNNLNILRINLGMYGFIVSVWGAFLPLVLGYNELLCAQDVLPVMIFALMTVFGGFLDLRGAAPHTFLQFGGIITNSVILFFTIIVSTLASYGKMTWVSDHLDTLRDSVVAREDLYRQASTEVSDMQQNIDIRRQLTTEEFEHEKVEHQNAQQVASTLHGKARRTRIGAVLASWAPQLMMLMFFFTIVVPVIFAFIVTDVPALSKMDKSDGGYSYKSKSPLSNSKPALHLIVGLALHWMLMTIILGVLKRSVVKGLSGNKNEKYRTVKHNLDSALTWTIWALGFSHILLVLSTGQWGALPLIQDGLHTGTALIGVGLIWMICLMMATIRVRSNTNAAVTGRSFFYCESPEDLSAAQARAVFRRQMSLAPITDVTTRQTSVVGLSTGNLPMSTGLDETGLDETGLDETGVNSNELLSLSPHSDKFPEPVHLVHQTPEINLVHQTPEIELTQEHTSKASKIRTRKRSTLQERLPQLPISPETKGGTDSEPDSNELP